MNVKLLTTADFDAKRPTSMLGELVRRHQLHVDVISMPNLPRDVHAALYHCGAVAVHPSLFEGGRGTFPFYEALSVGTSSISASGPHVLELLERCPEYEPFTFDPNDADGLARLITACIHDRDQALRQQMAVYERLRSRTWDVVAAEYAHVAAHGELP